MDTLQRAENRFNKLRNDRFAARALLSDEQRSFYDHSLTFLVEQAINNEQQTPISSISKLLNKGASLNFSPSELCTSNLADVLDVLKCQTPPTRVHYILTLLKPIVSSACDSWITNLRYAGNGGIGIPQFLTAFVVTGDVWGHYTRNTAIQMHHRYHAWSVLERMVWAYEQDRRIERSPFCCQRLVTRLLIDFLSNVSNRERAPPIQPAELQLFHNIVAFFRLRTTISKTISESNRPYLSPLATELLWRVDPKLSRNWYDHRRSSALIYRFICDHKLRKNTLHLLTFEGFRVHVLRPELVRCLCQRKDRVFFERLYHIDPRGLMKVVPFALQILESKMVRGRKERLIAFLKSIRVVQ